MNAPVGAPWAPTAEASPAAAGPLRLGSHDSPLARTPYGADWTCRAEESAAAAVEMRLVAAAVAGAEWMKTMVPLLLLLLRVHMMKMTPGCLAPAKRSSLSSVLIALHKQTGK